MYVSRPQIINLYPRLDRCGRRRLNGLHRRWASAPFSSQRHGPPVRRGCVQNTTFGGPPVVSSGKPWLSEAPASSSSPAGPSRSCQIPGDPYRRVILMPGPTAGSIQSAGTSLCYLIMRPQRGVPECGMTGLDQAPSAGRRPPQHIWLGPNHPCTLSVLLCFHATKRRGRPAIIFHVSAVYWSRVGRGYRVSSYID